MILKPKAFLDTSALFSGIWSSEGGARMILRLGEAESIQILVSPRVLEEIDYTLRQKAPKLLSILAIDLDKSRAETIPTTSSLDSRIQHCRTLVSHPGDAHVLAEAWDSSADFFVTLDREHFLNVPDLAAKLSFQLGTPGDFLAWYRDRLLRLVE